MQVKPRPEQTRISNPNRMEKPFRRNETKPIDQLHEHPGRRIATNPGMFKTRYLPEAFLLLLLFALTGTLSAGGLTRWVYCSENLWVDRNIDGLETLFRRAAKAGYTHVLLADSKFARLEEMDDRYFRNVGRIKQIAAELGLEIVPALFPVGYSNDLLWHDPNLIEALPVREALFAVHSGEARLQSDPDLVLKEGSLDKLERWDWKDETVIADEGAALTRDPGGRNARIVQKLQLTPFRQYHLTVKVKTRDFRGTPEVKILAGDRALNYNPLGSRATQDWTVHHVVFNSLEHAAANLYLGCWGAESGSLWFDDCTLEEVGLLNLVRRDGAPLTVSREDGTVLEEGTDYDRVVDPRMGITPWKGEYDVWHEPPVIRSSLPDGTRLRVSYYHAITIYDGQAMICPSEPRTVALLREQAQRVHAAWGARGYLMSHDEIRVLNWCEACRKRNLDAGELVADNVRTCIGILREMNPGGRIYTWSDMFDPHHNAHDDYYLVRGDLAGAWKGLDSEVIIMQWNFSRRDESLRWFAGRGHEQVIAGYYDEPLDHASDWLASAAQVRGIEGVMYTTWQRRFDDLERFASLVAGEPK